MDRVKLDPLERADLPDLEALQGLPYEHIRRALGELLGAPQLDSDTGAGGLLSAPLFSYDDNTGELTLGAFSFIELTRGPELSDGRTATPEARLVRFLPSDTNHPNHPLDLSAHNTPGGFYAVSARRVAVASDIATRRKWDSALGAEVSYTPATRWRERVEFIAHLESAPPADTPDTTAARWVKILSYQVSSAGALTLSFSSALDAKNSERATDETEAARISTAQNLGAAYLSSGEALTYGLLDHLAEIRAALYRIIDRGELDSEEAPLSSSRWFNPRRSLRSLAASLNTLTNTTTTNTALLEDQAETLDSLDTRLNHITLSLRLTYDTAFNTAWIDTAAHATQGAAPLIYFDHTDAAAGINGGQLIASPGAVFNTFSEALDLFRYPVIVFPAPETGTQPPAIVGLALYGLTEPASSLTNNNATPRTTEALRYTRRFSSHPFDIQPDSPLDNAARINAYTWTEHGNPTPRSDYALALAIENLSAAVVHNGAYSVSYNIHLTLNNQVSF